MALGKPLVHYLIYGYNNIGIPDGTEIIDAKTIINCFHYLKSWPLNTIVNFSFSAGRVCFIFVLF